MKLISVNAGQPQTLEWRGRLIRTSIFKSPVPGLVRVRRENIEGDGQSDLQAHGGVEKAVYAYPSEHYAAWKRELPQIDFPWGVFGENLTTEGLLEKEVRVGDRLRAGGAEFRVTQPRTPCYKLAARFGRADMVKRFWRGGTSGFYLAVEQEGHLAAGDRVELLARDEKQFTIAEVMAHYADEETDGN